MDKCRSTCRYNHFEDSPILKTTVLVAALLKFIYTYVAARLTGVLPPVNIRQSRVLPQYKLFQLLHTYFVIFLPSIEISNRLFKLFLTYTDIYWPCSVTLILCERRAFWECNNRCTATFPCLQAIVEMERLTQHTKRQ